MRPLLARTLLSMAALVALGVPTLAQAQQVVLPPLIPRGATDARDVTNITQLIYSELDFMPDIERVIEVTKTPDGYTVSCLDQASCLARVGKAEGGDHVLGGTLRVTDDIVTLDLVYYSVPRGRFVRRQTFELPNRPATIADNMDDVVQELITGVAPKADEATADDDIDLLDFDEDFALDFDEEDFEAAAAAEEERKREAEEEARRRAAEEARLAAEAEARRRAEEEEARRRAAEAERRRAEEEARLAALEAEEPDEPEEDFDPSMISFGSSSIVVEDESDEPDEDDLDPVGDSSFYEEPDEPAIVMLDEPDDEPRSSKPDKQPRTRSSRSGSGGSSMTFDDTPTVAQVSLRGGYSPYYTLGFVTVGIEGAYDMAETGVHAVVGLEAWSVQRQIPERFQQQAGAATEWNTVYPLNLGAVYKLDLVDGRVRPYAGGDLIMAQYYVPPEGGALGRWSLGARARAGVDAMIVRNVGVNLNVAIGGWGGGDWVVIEKDVRNAGLLPQISAGTVVAF